MSFRISRSTVRRAGIVPLAALLMTFLVGMLAFSIDIGYICAVESELQNAADSAALAGAQQMQSAFVSYYSPGQTNQQQVYTQLTTDTTNPASPIPTAQQYASYNKAGGVNINVPVTDISFWYYDGSTFTPASFPNYFPNTIQVTTRRDNAANGSLGLFFGQIFGMPTTNLTATSRATIYAGDVTSLKVIPGVDAHVLPVALDRNVWANFAKGNFTSSWLTGTSNGQTYNQVTTGPNGLPQLKVYALPPYDPGASSTNTPGNFGLLDLGPPATNSPAFRAWIDSGPTPNDINYLLTNSLLPVSPSAPQPWTVGTGLKSTLITNFQSVIGVPNLIPLFTPLSPLPNYTAASGNGSNATYAIVGFVGVTVSEADGTGSNGMTISLQPMAIVDPTAVILNPSPARAGQLTVFGTSQTTFISAKLTQ